MVLFRILKTTVDDLKTDSQNMAEEIERAEKKNQPNQFG